MLIQSRKLLRDRKVTAAHLLGRCIVSTTVTTYKTILKETKRKGEEEDKSTPDQHKGCVQTKDTKFEPSGPPSELPDAKRRGRKEKGKKNEIRSEYQYYRNGYGYFMKNILSSLDPPVTSRPLV
jgi:hypothetical protein